MGLSGMQKQVLSLYRGFLRAARAKKSPQDRRQIESIVSAEFRRNAKLVDRKSFLYIEYLLRRGAKQLDQIKSPGMEESWTIVDPEFGERPAQLTVIDEVLFCLHHEVHEQIENGPSTVFTYNLVTNRWVPVYGHTNFKRWATLPHLGNGKLCLAWAQQPRLLDKLVAKCTKFTVKKIPLGDRVLHIVATEESNESFSFSAGMCDHFITG